MRASIARGDVYVVNLVGHASAAFTGDPRAALARVAALPGARYGGVLHGRHPGIDAHPGGSHAGPGPHLDVEPSPNAGLYVDAGSRGGIGPHPGTRLHGGAGPRWWVACASPETLIEVAGGRAVTRPIKGTRPATPAGRAELLASAKERAEHVMIVDLERNDLGRIARVGSVRVDELFAIRRWSGLWQAESTVSATLADGVGLADLLAAVWPGGSVTGAPKLAAIDVAHRLEPVGRGPSMGAFGWIGHGPDRRLTVDLGLTIRTVAIADGRAHIWAGGGIVWDSDPAAEVAEAAAKSAPIKAALSGAY